MQDESELRWLRRAFALAEEAVSLGDQPFGAVIVGPDGAVLAEGMNTRARTGDATGHAETIACRDASLRVPARVLRRSTLYSSAEPCPMCTGAAAWTVCRLVFGLSQAALYGLFGTTSPPRFGKPVSSRVLLDIVQPPFEVVGPLLEDEAMRAHEQWKRLHPEEYRA